MPFANTFRKGMGFPIVGQTIGGFKVRSVSVGCIGACSGRYEYPTELIVQGAGGMSKVKKAFSQFYKDRRTLFSGYGNPYQCWHEKIMVQRLGDDRFMITSRGACARVHLLPELKKYMEYLFEKGYITKSLNMDKSEEIIREYAAEYQRSTLRAKPLFESTDPVR